MDMDQFMAAMKKFRQADYNSIDVNNFYEAHFDRMDKDHDGRVDVDQLTDFLMAEDKTGHFSKRDEARNVITEVKKGNFIKKKPGYMVAFIIWKCVSNYVLNFYNKY